MRIKNNLPKLTVFFNSLYIPPNLFFMLMLISFFVRLFKFEFKLFWIRDFRNFFFFLSFGINNASIINAIMLKLQRLFINLKIFSLSKKINDLKTLLTVNKYKKKESFRMACEKYKFYLKKKLVLITLWKWLDVAYKK